MHNICIFSFYDVHDGQYCWFTRAQKNLTKVYARTILDSWRKNLFRTLYYSLNMLILGEFSEELSLPQSLYGGYLSLQRNEL